MVGAPAEFPGFVFGAAFADAVRFTSSVGFRSVSRSFSVTLPPAGTIIECSAAIFVPVGFGFTAALFPLTRYS